MYVDDLVSGSYTIEEVEVIKQNLLSYFEKADLICISGTQIYRHDNLPIQSLKVNLTHFSPMSLAIPPENVRKS